MDGMIMLQWWNYTLRLEDRGMKYKSEYMRTDRVVYWPQVEVMIVVMRWKELY